jgi:hypothetical protein
MMIFRYFRQTQFKYVFDTQIPHFDESFLCFLKNEEIKIKYNTPNSYAIFSVVYLISHYIHGRHCYNLLLSSYVKYLEKS